MKSLVDYSSDSEDETENTSSAGSVTTRLPVPSCLVNNLKRDEGPDDSGRYEGRVRSFPHERGNWASLVYIPYEKYEDLSILMERLIETCRDTDVELKPISEPHISLSRTFVLLYHWIQGFVATVKTSLSTVHSFRLEIEGIDVYVNDEGTRTFLGLMISCGGNHVADAVHLLDNCLHQYKLKSFYKEGRFHMSICWCLGNRSDYLKTKLSTLRQIVAAFFTEYPETAVVDVEQLVCKIGNRLYWFQLTS